MGDCDHLRLRWDQYRIECLDCGRVAVWESDSSTYNKTRL